MGVLQKLDLLRGARIQEHLDLLDFSLLSGTAPCNDMYSGFCRNTQFQTWSSGCVLDLVAWEDLGHYVLHFDLLFAPANEFQLFHFTLTSCSRKCNSLSDIEQYVGQSRKTQVLLLFSRRDLVSLLQKWYSGRTKEL